MALDVNFSYVSPVYTSEIDTLAATLYSDWQTGASSSTELAKFDSLATPITLRFGAGTESVLGTEESAFSSALAAAGSNSSAQYTAIENAVVGLEVSVTREYVLQNVALVLHAERLVLATAPANNIAASDLGQAIAGAVAFAGVPTSTIASAATAVVNGISGSFPGFGEIDYAAGTAYDSFLAADVTAADDAAFQSRYPSTTTQALSSTVTTLAQDFSDAGLGSFAPFAKIVHILSSSLGVFEEAAYAEAQNKTLIAAVDDTSKTGAAKEQEIGAAVLQLSQTIAGQGYGAAELTAATIDAGAVYLLRHGGAFAGPPPIHGIVNNAFDLLLAEKQAGG